jgi:hypothetical protein
MAPELFQYGLRPTTAVDMFSFGVLAWEVVTGERPWMQRGHVLRDVAVRPCPDPNPKPACSAARRCAVKMRGGPPCPTCQACPVLCACWLHQVSAKAVRQRAPC